MRKTEALKIDSPYDTNYDLNSLNMSKIGMGNDMLTPQEQKEIKKKKKYKNSG